MAGDTVLKLILLSNPHMRSQNRYIDTNANDSISSDIDIPYVKLFKYDQISKMSLVDVNDVDIKVLEKQLNELNISNESWILKSHVYNKLFPYTTIDIVCNEHLLPFVVKATLIKNSRELGRLSNYHPLISKIKDPKILKKFDMFSIAKDIINPTELSSMQLSVNDILGGWNQLVISLDRLSITLDQKYKTIYNQWLDNNKSFMPSHQYHQLVSDQNFDYTQCNLSDYEKYCLLALSGEKFKVL